MFKLYESLIFDRIQGHLMPKLISKQAGFKPEKSSTGEVLNITKLVEDGFEWKEIATLHLY